MKILCWNVDFKTDYRLNLEYITSHSFDVLLLQEARHQLAEELLNNGFNVQSAPIGGSRAWGSLIATRSYSITPIRLIGHEGWVSIGLINVQNHQIYVASIHAKLKDIGLYVVPHLQDIFTGLLAILPSNAHIIIGGDFNAARLYDTVYPNNPPNAKHTKFFDWLENELNLISVTYVKSNTEYQTVRLPLK